MPARRAASTAIGFSRARGWSAWFSRIVRALTKSPVSHVWILYHDADFQALMIIEAHAKGFRLVPYTMFIRENEVVAIYRPRINIDAGLPEAAKWLGTYYDYAGLVGMAVVIFGRWLKKRWRNPWRSSRSQFCSEAVVRVLQYAKYPGIEHLDSETTDPKQLLDLFNSDGSTPWRPEE